MCVIEGFLQLKKLYGIIKRAAIETADLQYCRPAPVLQPLRAGSKLHQAGPKTASQ